MATDPRSSFIPKETTGVMTATGTRKRTQRVGIFSLVSSALFIGSLILAGGAYLYKDFVVTQLEEQKKAFTDEVKQFSDDDISGLQAFDRRLNAVAYRLDTHLEFSRFLDVLERVTKEGVQFTSFTLVVDDADEISARLDGVAGNFKIVALQAEELLEEDSFAGVVFGGVTKSLGSEEGGATDTESDSVGFTVTLDIDPDEVSYNVEQSFEDSGVNPAAVAPSEPAAEFLLEDTQSVTVSSETNTNASSSSDDVVSDSAVQ